ncbi:MAG: SMC-Scp complex subunit ScpB [Ruminococcaceae bacterium]|nr:SMC-Scp complex subunit ScpB [Oscillospiraceae bacterium]
MEIKEAIRTIEAVIFASGEPVSLSRLSQVLEIDEDTVAALCNKLSDRMDESDSALVLVRTEDKYQICTRAEYAPYIRAALELRRNTPLSAAAMEVLAIIAYNEPVTRNLIERVRGVDCSGVISSLLSKGLIEEKGRLDLPGRPMQYQTSALFLRCFGIQSLSQLPKLPSEDDEQIKGQMTVEEVIEGTAESRMSYADDAEDFELPFVDE